MFREGRAFEGHSNKQGTERGKCPTTEMNPTVTVLTDFVYRQSSRCRNKSYVFGHVSITETR